MDESLDDTAKCFVPEMLVDYIHKNIRLGKEGLEPASFYFTGVCLLVDISGFTKLSGDFCAQGKSGIDELQLVTNGYMGQLVEIIYTFGGEIIKFAGDAIICVFSSTFTTKVSTKNKPGRGNMLRRSRGSFGEILLPEGLSLSRASTNFTGQSFLIPPIVTKEEPIVSPALVLRAMQCAHQLREVQTDKLTVHVAMSCGEMCFGVLGGFENRWECLISGPCIHQLSDCLDDAPSKEAVMSNDCGDIVLQCAQAVPNPDSTEPPSYTTTVFSTESSAYEFSLESLSSGNYRIVNIANSMAKNPSAAVIAVNNTYNAVASKLIHQFVPVPIAEELESAVGLAYLAEIREVTTMFMKWDSYDANGKHRDLLDLQPCFLQAQRILQTTGAYLRQFLVDDKGCVLIGCWGMPHLSYLDNAERALSAAAQIKQELNKLDMSCSFGITTGDVYCGTVGSALRMEYAAIGSVVNMSARLMCKANGGILIDDATYTRLPATVHETLKQLDPIKVKGRDEPLQVYAYMASAGIIQVKEKVVEDHEISAECKEKLLLLIDKLTAVHSIVPSVSGTPIPNKQSSINGTKKWYSGKGLPTNSESPLSTPNYLRKRFSSSLMFNGATANTVVQHIPVCVLSGKEGSGRTTVVKWFTKKVTEHNIPIMHVKVAKKDASVPYSVWRKIFALLTTKSQETQLQCMLHLLEDVYANSTPQHIQYAYLVIKNALGVTVPVTEAATEHSKGGWLSRKLSPSMKPLTPQQIDDTLLFIFAHVLIVQTRLVVIENIEQADEESLHLLSDLCRINANSAILLTALDWTASECTEEQLNSAWNREYKEILYKMPNTTNIVLNNYTPEEIDQMLCVTLGVENVPPEISQLVQDFSGGAHFWVLEILQFLKDHGSEQFMSAIGEKNKSPNVTHLHPSVDPNGYNNYGGRKSKPAPVVVSSHMHRTPSMHRAPSMHRSPSVYSNSIHLNHGDSNGPGVNVRSPSMRQIDRAHSLKAPSLNRGPATVHQAQLDKLVLCRFGNLTSDTQRILRTASIIGITFNIDVLYHVLPTRLQSALNDALLVLFGQKWLYVDEEDESLYQFVHPHAYRVIYELIPSAERNHTHRLIAHYIENNCVLPDTEVNATITTEKAIIKNEKVEQSGNNKAETVQSDTTSISGSGRAISPNVDPAQYGVLCFHYQHCDPDRALQYAVKATSTLLEGEFLYEISDCIDLLTGCVGCCKSTYDIEVLLRLIDNTRAAVRAFQTERHKFGTSINKGQIVRVGTGKSATSWLKRISSIGSNISNMLMSPLNRQSSKIYVSSTDTDAAESPVIHNPNATTPTDHASVTTAVKSHDDFAYEKRTKRQLLQQLSRLYDLLHENLNKLQEAGSSLEAHEWQIAFLAPVM